MRGKGAERVANAQTLSTAIRGDADTHYSGSEGVSILMGGGKPNTLRQLKKVALTRR